MMPKRAVRLDSGPIPLAEDIDAEWTQDRIDIRRITTDYPKHKNAGEYMIDFSCIQNPALKALLKRYFRARASTWSGQSMVGALSTLKPVILELERRYPGFDSFASLTRDMLEPVLAMTGWTDSMERYHEVTLERRHRVAIYLKGMFTYMQRHQWPEAPQQQVPIVGPDGQIFWFRAHEIRHTVGTDMINNGMGLADVMTYLDHRSPEMTRNYTLIYDETLKHKFKELVLSGRVVGGLVLHALREQIASGDESELDWVVANLRKLSLPWGQCLHHAKASKCPYGQNMCFTKDNGPCHKLVTTALACPSDCRDPRGSPKKQTACRRKRLGAVRQ
jgi:hypothetical protein